MTDEAETGARHELAAKPLAEKLHDLTGAARDMTHAALRETLSWSAYQWSVLALLTAIFLLLALSYGGIRSELAALKRDASAPQDRTAIEADLGNQMSDLKSSLTQALADMKAALAAEIAKTNAKLDARAAPKPAAPAQRPARQRQP